MKQTAGPWSFSKAHHLQWGFLSAITLTHPLQSPSLLRNKNPLITMVHWETPRESPFKIVKTHCYLQPGVPWPCNKMIPGSGPQTSSGGHYSIYLSWTCYSCVQNLGGFYLRIKGRVIICIQLEDCGVEGRRQGAPRVVCGSCSNRKPILYCTSSSLEKQTLLRQSQWRETFIVKS